MEQWREQQCRSLLRHTLSLHTTAKNTKETSQHTETAKDSNRITTVTSSKRSAPMLPSCFLLSAFLPDPS